jgi:hypothetical protein
MARDLLSPLGILDATHGAARRAAAPWLGVFWLASIPLRFLQVHFVRELAYLAGEAGEYGDYLTDLAWLVFAALVPAVWGRALWMRACHLALQSGARPGPETLRVPTAQVANTLYLTLLVEALFAITLWTFVAAPWLTVAGGLACAAALRTPRPGLLRPVLELLRLSVHFRVVIGLGFTYSVAFVLAFLNVYIGLRGIVWAASAVMGRELARCAHVLRPVEVVPIVPAESIALAACVAGAMLVVEPFWLASLAVFVHRAELRHTGEDLRLRFRTLTGKA